MATKLVQPPIPSSQVVPTIPIITKMMRTHRAFSATHPSIKKNTVIGQYPNGFRLISTIKVAEQSSGVVGDDEETKEEPSEYNKTIAQVKAELYEALQGTNRGIFGVPTAKKSEIEDFVKLLESQNPTPDPILHLEKVGGCWKLVYSTIRILGPKRTKLGLRDFISLADFLQTIDVVERVDITYRNSTITPDQLMNLFRKNYDILLRIFNPEGWLEITYVDDTLRIGRDDKGNIFILERAEEESL